MALDIIRDLIIKAIETPKFKKEELRERTVDAIHRDRLAEFHKLSNELESGCFYRALARVWEQLYPGRVLPRDAERRMLELGRKKKNIAPPVDQMIGQIRALHDVLGFEVYRAGIPYKDERGPEEAQKHFGIPEDVDVVKYIDKFIPIYGDERGIAYLTRSDGSHAEALDVEWTGVFEGEGITVNNVARQGYTPRLILHIRKTR